MATVAQLVEPSVVIRVVAGSSPVGRPIPPLVGLSLENLSRCAEVFSYSLADLSVLIRYLSTETCGNRLNFLKFHIKDRPTLTRAAVVKLVDTLDLGSSAARRGGSSPSSRTNQWMVTYL